MGGNSKYGRKASSILSILSLLKPNRGRKSSSDEEDMWEESETVVRRVRSSDEDKGWWVAEPDIDNKASAFIARFYESRVSESDLQTMAI